MDSESCWRPSKDSDQQKAGRKKSHGQRIRHEGIPREKLKIHQYQDDSADADKQAEFPSCEGVHSNQVTFCELPGEWYLSHTNWVSVRSGIGSEE